MTRPTAIITGGSRGIGAAMADKLGELGYNVVLDYHSDSSKEKAEAVAKSLEEKYGVETLVVQSDVSQYDDCVHLVQATVEKFGDQIDCLVNNAGITNNSNWIDIKPEAYERVIAINLMSALHMTSGFTIHGQPC